MDTKREHSPETQRTSKKRSVWPASQRDIIAAREFIERSATSGEKILLVPDRDADGLTGGLQIYKTLLLLGASEDNISIHFVSKGSNIHVESEREVMQKHDPKFVIVVDQGSRMAPPIISPEIPTLIIDHHQSTMFPEKAQILSACMYEPVATSSLLCYVVCKELHPEAQSQIDWLAVIGALGDLGTSLKFEEPFPTELQETCKKYGKKKMSDAVALLNAPRRTPECNTLDAWNCLLTSSSPDFLVNKNEITPVLQECKERTKSELEKWSHVPPKFSKDRRIAVFTITSEYQIHPVIASRWTHLKDAELEMICVANDGYLPNRVHFACRIPRSKKDQGIDLIALLKEYAKVKEDLPERLGDNFARGHKEATGGNVSTEIWQEILECFDMEERKKKEKKIQKNTLLNYFSATK